MTPKQNFLLPREPLSASYEHSGKQHLQIFVNERPRLLGLAYRILGSRADAEDVVQDTFIRWQQTDLADVSSPGAWLTSTCARRAIDTLRAAYRTRVDYVGNWLPEPVQVNHISGAESGLEQSASLSTAFLLVLERLTPKERAAYLLYEIFELSYAGTAGALGTSEQACRKLVSRAKARINSDKVRFQPTPQKQKELLTAFQAAIRDGDPGKLTEVLSSDVRLTADGGGKVPSVAGVLEAEAVLALLTQKLPVWWAPYDWSFTDINGSTGVILRQGGKVMGVVSFAFDQSDRVTEIFIVRNPDKLQHLGQISIC